MARAREETLRWRHWVRRGAQIVIIAAALLYLGFNLRTLNDTEIHFVWRWSYLFFAFSSTLAAVWLGALGWWQVLRIFRLPIALPQAARIHLQSNLAKYLPGYAWQLIGKAYLTRQQEIRARDVSRAMLVELFAVLAPGITLAAILTYILSPLPLPPFIIRLVRLSGAGASLTLLLLPIAWQWLIQQRRLQTPFVSGAYWRAILIMSIGWLCFGVGFWALAATLTPIPWETVPLFLFTITTSFLVSLAILFVPGGIGVRESIMTLLLAPLLGRGAAALTATLARLILIGAEVTALLLVLLLARHENPNHSPFSMFRWK